MASARLGRLLAIWLAISGIAPHDAPAVNSSSAKVPIVACASAQTWSYTSAAVPQEPELARRAEISSDKYFLATSALALDRIAAIRIRSSRGLIRGAARLATLYDLHVKLQV
jgi:hypothetical protein